MPRSSGRAVRVLRLTFVALMAFAWTGGVPWAIARQAPPAPGPDTAAAVEQLERLLAGLEAADAEAPKDTFDPRAVVATVGREPDKLFAWVRDQTHWAPYSGVLRGPAGVLMDRIGGSLDRSLLLAELLSAAGAEVRLARADLSTDRCAELAKQVRPIPADRFAAERRAEDGAAPDLQAVRLHAQKANVDPDAVVRAIEQATAEQVKLSQAAAGRMKAQVPRLAKAVAAPGDGAAVANPDANQGADAGAEPSAEAVAALADHWWVQRRDGERWVDLDPLLPDASPGKAAAAALETLPYDPKVGELALDAARYHEVELRVVSEQTTGDERIESTLLTQVLRPAELYGKDLTLGFIPMGWPADLKLTGKGAADRLRKAVLEQKEWVPALGLGGKTLFQKGVRPSGEVIETPEFNPTARLGGGAAKKVGGLGGLFDQAEAGPDKAPAAQPSHLTAMWVEYEIRSPGKATRTVRRQVFDLIGPAARAAAPAEADAGAKAPARGAPRRLPATIPRAQQLDRSLAMLGRTQVMVLGCSQSAEFVQHLLTRRMLANRDVYLRLVKDGSNDPERLLKQAEGARPLPGPLHGLFLARSAWGPRGDVYLDAPNVFTATSRPRDVREHGVAVCSGFDIVANDVAVRPGAADPFAARLAQGVCDTNAEALLAAGCGKVQNTAEAFGAEGGGEWVTLRAPGEAKAAGLKLPADVLARVEADVAAGSVVVVPRRPAAVDGRPFVGWWRVDPATGTTLGIGETGAGVSAFEYVDAFMNGAAFATCCALIAAADGDFTQQDAVACAGVFFAGGGATLPVFAAASQLPWLIGLGYAGAILAGLSRNKDLEN